MSKQITVKFGDGDYYLELEDFRELLDIDQVHSYKLEQLDDGFSIQFFDIDGNELVPNVEV